MDDNECFIMTDNDIHIIKGNKLNFTVNKISYITDFP